MSMTGMPGAVAPNTVTRIQQQAKRTGLLRMAVGSLHRVPLEGGAPHVVARDRHDFPGAKVVYLCLHDRCAGKTWGSHEALRLAHPDSAQMAKSGESHVYGMWSDDLLDPAALEKAKAGHKKAAKELDDVRKMPITTLADKEAVKEYVAAAELAATAVEAAGCCIGLLAPPEHREE